MKITEIYDAVISALHREKFVGDFTVTISHPRLQEDVEIAGYKRDSAAFPYDFSQILQSKINEACFMIVSGVMTNEDFIFSINGRIEYEYTPEE